MGVVFVLWPSQPLGTMPLSACASYFSISLSLDILLMLMVIPQLLHTQNAIEARAGTCGVYNMVIAVAIESSALYIVNLLTVLVLWAANSPAIYTFFPILIETQVCVIFVFPSCVSLVHAYLINVANRSLPHSSPPCELRIEVHGQTILLSPGRSVLFASGAEEG